jgi:hypothetical protein
LGPRASHKSLAAIIFRRLLGSWPHNVLRGEDDFKRKLRRFLITDDSGDESAVNFITRPARTVLDLNQDAQAAANVSIIISRFGIG